MRTATLIINDEVNLKVSGLELDVRKKLVNTFKYDVPHARYLPAVRLGRWDGKVAYFQMGGSTYLNLLPEIIPILEDFNYDIDIQDNREYQTVFKFDSVAEDTYSDIMWPKNHPASDTPYCSKRLSSRNYKQFLKKSTVYTRSSHWCRQNNYDCKSK